MSSKQEKRDVKGITVKKFEDMPEWYSQAVVKGELADYFPKIRGTMVIRPYGYSIWQKVMDYFNSRLQKIGVENAYFPLFVPESFFKKEAEHAEGFAPEVAWVENKEESEERFALRPTSETVMYYSYAKWIRSYRDLPLRINQWCNIIRWEIKDVKLFIRSREFLWQEGHCVYETEEECDQETLTYLNEYAKLLEELLAVPVIKGRKSEKERFAGAHYTLSIEGYMPDGKFLQCGTSHNLGQGFANAFEISFVGKDEKKHLPWQNSWGLSTRVIGAIVLQHGDDKGLVLPPNIAPLQVIIVPIFFEKTIDQVINEARTIKTELENSCSVKTDERQEYSAGWRYSDWELKGVPLRIEIGPRDIKKNQVVLVRRDTGEKMIVTREELKEKVKETLTDIQESLYNRAKENIEKNIVKIDTWDDFEKAAEERKIIYAPFCGEVECEDLIKAETKGANSRCIPLKQESVENKSCIYCDKEAKYYTYFGKSY
ncbi:MAG: proline--tRNA ligase [Candidatus Hodarchaeales archaeon]|jgi:prolyl-tRNA synthetase